MSLQRHTNKSRAGSRARVLIGSSRRRESGLWETQAVDEKQDRNIASQVIRDLKELSPTSESVDAFCFYPRLENAGDVGSPDLYPIPLQQEILKVHARYRVAGFASSYARVRSRTGLIGGLYIAHEFGHCYSASDLAVFGAFAELTSFALS
jgi:hypothetical protein